MSSWRVAGESDGGLLMEGDRNGGSRTLDQVETSRCADWQRTMTLDCTRVGGKIKRYSVWSCCTSWASQCFPENALT